MTIQSARIPSVFSAHDSNIASLPKELVAARQAVIKFDAALAHLGPPPVRADVRERELAVELAGRALTGEVSVDVDELEALEVTGRDCARRATVLRQAREVAGQHLGVLVEDMSDEIIENHLAPALDAVVDDLKAAVGKCSGHELSDSSMLTAAKSVREAWVSLSDLAAKYGILRSVRGALVRVNDTERNDTTHLFAEVRNVDAVWDDVGRDGVSPVLLVPEKAPWHHPDAKSRLVKMLNLGCDLWVPTVAQQEVRWLEVYGARLEQGRQNRQRAAAVHGAFGSVAPAPGFVVGLRGEEAPVVPCRFHHPAQGGHQRFPGLVVGPARGTTPLLQRRPRSTP